MELSLSAYMSPWTSCDYSLCLKISICGEWMESTSRSHIPFDMTSYARELANLNAMSDEVLLDHSYVPDGVMKFELRIIPHQSGELAAVEVSTIKMWERGDAVSENYRRELVPIQVINAFGIGLLAAMHNNLIDFEFHFPTDR